MFLEEILLSLNSNLATVITTTDVDPVTYSTTITTKTVSGERIVIVTENEVSTITVFMNEIDSTKVYKAVYDAVQNKDSTIELSIPNVTESNANLIP